MGAIHEESNKMFLFQYYTIGFDLKNQIALLIPK